jgi:hypothetical protein
MNFEQPDARIRNNCAEQPRRLISAIKLECNPSHRIRAIQKEEPKAKTRNTVPE